MQGGFLQPVDKMPTSALGVILFLVFVWRFARTHELYVTSLRAHKAGLKAEPLNPRDPRSILEQTLMGRRIIQPKSFFIRGLVLAAVALCLLPFKGYEPSLWWLVIVFIALYVPWCVVHGIMLERNTRSNNSD